MRSLRRSKKHNNVLFWAYNFLECYVRGLNPYLQVFYTANSLLKELIDSVQQFREDSLHLVIQIKLDLLGELIKFNLFNLTAMDRFLHQESKHEEFYSIVDRNLVDSNVFIRSLLQSEYYRIELASEHLTHKIFRTAAVSRGDRRVRGSHFGRRGCPSSSAIPDKSKHDNDGDSQDKHSTPRKEKVSKRGFSSTVGTRTSKNPRTALLAKLGYKINQGTNTWTAKCEVDEPKCQPEIPNPEEEVTCPCEHQDSSDTEIGVPSPNHLQVSAANNQMMSQSNAYESLIQYPSECPKLIEMLLGDLRNVLWRLFSVVSARSLRYDSRPLLTYRHLLYQHCLHHLDCPFICYEVTAS